MRAPRCLRFALLAAVAGGCHHRTITPGGETAERLCAPLAPLPRRIWRLSSSQMASSVSDLLGMPMPGSPGLALLAGERSYALFSDDSLSLDAAAASALDTALDQVMAEAAPLIPGLAACQPDEPETACATRFARSFGQRAFRRPLGDDEVADLMTVYAEGRKQDFDAGISDMIEALFHAPSFLFRTEIGSGSDATATLTSYEVASQLAYTVLGSTPDQALLDAATTGRLDTPAGTAAEVERLLATEAGRRNITAVVGAWMHAPQVFLVTKDPALGVALPDQAALESDLYASVLRSVDDVLWNGSGLVADLLTFDHLFVNQRLATVYGLPFGGGAPDDFVPVLAPEGQRAGLLTHPAALWAASDSPTTEIVGRGMFVRDAIVCADPLPHPTDLEASPEVVAAEGQLATEIDRSNYRLGQPACTSCHAQIDPYGRVLEGLDGLGRPRALADGAPVDATGNLGGVPPLQGRIAGPDVFAGAVIAGGQLQGCAARRISSYVIGRTIPIAATCEVRQVRDGFERAGGTMSALLEQVVTAPFARTRASTAP